MDVGWRKTCKFTIVIKKRLENGTGKCKCNFRRFSASKSKLDRWWIIGTTWRFHQLCRRFKIRSRFRTFHLLLLTCFLFVFAVFLFSGSTIYDKNKLPVKSARAKTYREWKCLVLCRRKEFLCKISRITPSQYKWVIPASEPRESVRPDVSEWVISTHWK